jgi:hypothetical protein
VPRFYFHVHGRQDRLTDEQGLVLPDAEAAWYQAVRSAREIIRGDLHLGCRFEDQIIEIADERGAPVDHIPLLEIARYAT